MLKNDLKTIEIKTEKGRENLLEGTFCHALQARDRKRVTNPRQSRVERHALKTRAKATNDMRQPYSTMSFSVNWEPSSVVTFTKYCPGESEDTSKDSKLRPDFMRSPNS